MNWFCEKYENAVWFAVKRTRVLYWMLDFSVRIGAGQGTFWIAWTNAASAIWRILATDWQKCGYTGSSKAERRFLRFIRTKNNRAPDGEDRYAFRSTCFLAEDRNSIEFCQISSAWYARKTVIQSYCKEMVLLLPDASLRSAIWTLK